MCFWVVNFFLNYFLIQTGPREYENYNQSCLCNSWSIWEHHYCNSCQSKTSGAGIRQLFSTLLISQYMHNQKSYFYTSQMNFSYLGPWCVWIWFCLPGLLIITSISELYQKGKKLGESQIFWTIKMSVSWLCGHLFPTGINYLVLFGIDKQIK